MNKTLANYLCDTEDVFDNTTDTNENYELEKALSELIKKLPEIESNIDTNVKIDFKAPTIIVFISQIITNSAIEQQCMFAQYENTMWFYNSKHWSKIPPNLFKEFLKRASIKIGTPNLIASSVAFVNKLQKQIIQDAYFDRVVLKDKTLINLKNTMVSIGREGVGIDKHHPRYFCKYVFDFDYIIDEKSDDFEKYIKDSVISSDVAKTLQQSIGQILVPNFHFDKKICLHGLSSMITTHFFNGLAEVIPQELISIHFNNEDTKLEDLFISFEDIKKDQKSLNNVVIVPCNNLSDESVSEYTFKNKPAIFNWLLDGAKEIIKNRKLYIANECSEFNNRFNLVSLFVKESGLVKTPKTPKSITTSFESVYKQYEAFCELNDEKPLGNYTFNKELKALGFEGTRRESGNVWFAKFA
jgi:hypothetical protein